MSRTDVGRNVLAVLGGTLGLVLALPVAVVLLPFWLIGLATRGLARLLEPRPLAWDELIEFHPEVGWRPKKNLTALALDLNGDTFRFTTDDAGWRGRRSVAECDVIVYGDSYAFGFGVDDGDFFADRSRDVRVKAVGAPGYSMVQPVLWMERMKADLRGKLVVWLVYPGNDLEDNLRPAVLKYRTPFVRSLNGSGSWEIVTEHVDPSYWTLTSSEGGIQGLVEICTSAAPDDRVFGACAYLIERAAAICRSVDARLVVMTVPDLSPAARREMARFVAEAPEEGARFDEELPDRRIAAICRRLGVGFVALKDHLDPGDYLEHDFHWNARGHRRVARLIRRLYLEPNPTGRDRLPSERSEADDATDGRRAANIT